MIEAFIASGSTVTLLAIAGWLARTWIKERLTADLRLETESKLEELKAQLAKANDSLSMLTSTGNAAMSQAQAALLEHKIKAIKTIWQSVHAWQKTTTVTTFAALMSIEWVKKYGSDPSTKANFDRLLNDLDHLKFMQARNDTELVRPLLSEKSWALYFAYHSFYASRLIKASFLTIPNIDHAALWERSNERELVVSSAPKEILDEYDSNFLIGTSSFINYLKEQMIEEFQAELSGRRDSQAAVSNASSILLAAENLLASTQKEIDVPKDKPLGGHGDA
jgi:hypothetical protein